MSDFAFGKDPVVTTPELHNRMVRATVRVEAQDLGKGIPNLKSPISQTSVEVQNDTEADLPQGAVVDVGDYLLDRDDNPLDPAHLWHEGVTQAGGHYGVLRKALPDGEIGECQLIGPVIARVKMMSLAHKFATPKSGETYFESAESGPVAILGLSDPAASIETVQECDVCLRGGGGSSTPRIAGKAKVSSGSYPTLQAWSEASANQQTVWQFKLGTLNHDITDADGVATFTDGASYVKAYNLKKWHYIPENTILELVTIDGKYYVEYEMPSMLFGTLDDDVSDSTVLVKLEAHDRIAADTLCEASLFYADSGYVLLEGTTVVLGRKDGATVIGYRIISVNQCPVEVEE